MLRWVVRSFLSASLAVCLVPMATAAKFVSIGTGSMTGVYYPTGGNIAKLVNKKKKIYNIRMSVESTAGSVYNINGVLSGDLEFGIAQSDRQYQAYKGTAEWQGRGPQKKLRSICSFHREAVTLLASEASKIATLADLKGKTVNLGNPGSGQRGNAVDVLRTAGIAWDKDIKAESVKASEAPKLLQDSRLDAFFFTVGHPSGTITEATSGRVKVRFVPITGVSSLLDTFPYYARTTIPHKQYPLALNQMDIETIGVTATFVTSTDVSDDVVYAVTRELFENLEEFKQLHPAYAQLTPENMLEGLTAPLHPGAYRYFKEAKLVN